MILLRAIGLVRAWLAILLRADRPHPDDRARRIGRRLVQPLHGRRADRRSPPTCTGHGSIGATSGPRERRSLYAGAHDHDREASDFAPTAPASFEARTDSQGARLHSSCNYVHRRLQYARPVVEPRGVRRAGHLIANDADRYDVHGRYGRAQSERVVRRHARARRAARQLASDERSGTTGAGVHGARSRRRVFRTKQRAERNKLLPVITPRGMLMRLVRSASTGGCW